MMKLINLICLIILTMHSEGIASPLCKKAADKCVDGSATKRIDGYEVHRDCWQYESTYECTEGNSQDNCSALRESGCFEVSNKCKTYHKEKCIDLDKKFKCYRDEKYYREEERSRVVDSDEQIEYACEGEIPHLDGAYADKSYKKNDEMMSSISQLSILSEMQGQIKDEFDKLFKGTSDKCTKAKYGFKNCCDKGKGWGVNLKLGHCSPEDIKTADRNSKGLCHEVGEYCSKKIFPVGCVAKRRTFCCFPSKIAKALQEQGRKQLGIGWGTPENPDCRGFTREELAKIDFSKLDLKEVYQDLIKNFKNPNLDKINKDIKREMEVMQSDFKDNMNDQDEVTNDYGINKKYKEKEDSL